jgi:hypothetical protein
VADTVYGRAALLGCIAIGIRLEAVQVGIAAVDLSMEVDCDDRRCPPAGHALDLFAPAV